MASNPLLDSISQYSLDDFFSKEANNEKTSDLFYKKTFYEGVFVSEYSNLTNFNFGEKLLYGRVNRKYIPIEGNFGRYGLKYFSRNQTVSS